MDIEERENSSIVIENVSVLQISISYILLKRSLNNLRSYSALVSIANSNISINENLSDSAIVLSSLSSVKLIETSNTR